MASEQTKSDVSDVHRAAAVKVCRLVDDYDGSRIDANFVDRLVEILSEAFPPSTDLRASADHRAVAEELYYETFHDDSNFDRLVPAYSAILAKHFTDLRAAAAKAWHFIDELDELAIGGDGYVEDLLKRFGAYMIRDAIRQALKGA